MVLFLSEKGLRSDINMNLTFKKIKMNKIHLWFKVFLSCQHLFSLVIRTPGSSAWINDIRNIVQMSFSRFYVKRVITLLFKLHGKKIY